MLGSRYRSFADAQVRVSRLARVRFPPWRGPNALGTNCICQARGLVDKRQEWLSPSIAIALIGLIINAIAVIPGIIPYFQRPEVIYSTSELTTYPMTYHDNKPAPADIQGKVLLRGPIKALSLMVQNEGERSADVLVRIPLSKGDGYLGGWMSKSEAPSIVYMLGVRTEYRLHKLLPGDRVTFYLNLENVNSNLADRIEVFDGDGRRAIYYRYVAVRYIGRNVIIVSLRKSWIYLIALMMVVIMLLSVSWIRRTKQPAVSADRKRPEDATEYLPTSSRPLTAWDQKSRDRPPSDSTAGKR